MPLVFTLPYKFIFFLSLPILLYQIAKSLTSAKYCIPYFGYLNFLFSNFVTFPKISYFSSFISLIPMAPKRSKQGKSFNIAMADFLKMIKEFIIPSSSHVRLIKEDKERRWRGEGLGTCVLVLGRHHNETLCFPIHPLILQFTTAYKVHTMQLARSSLKCIAASIILNEVEGKGIKS